MQNTQAVFDKNLFQFEAAHHKDKPIIWVKFQKDFKLIALLKAATKPRWSQSQKSWYVADNNFNRDLFGLDRKIVGKEVLLKIHPNNLDAFSALSKSINLKRIYPKYPPRLHLRICAVALYH